MKVASHFFFATETVMPFVLPVVVFMCMNFAIERVRVPVDLYVCLCLRRLCMCETQRRF